MTQSLELSDTNFKIMAIIMFKKYMKYLLNTSMYFIYSK